MKRNMKKLLAALIAISIAGVALCCTRKQEEEILILEEQTLPEAPREFPTETEAAYIWVSVYGAVQHPGVYRLKKDSRVFELIALAGGFTEAANQASINLAQQLSDEQQYYVAEEGELQQEAVFAATDSDRTDLINLNSASLQELMTLPGIGEVKAQAIIDYRQQHPFENIEELMNVSGIKQNSFDKIKDKIKV